MTRIRRIRRRTRLPQRAGALLGSAAAPAVLWADPPRPRPPGWNKHPPLPTPARAAVRFSPGWNKHPPLPAHTHLAGTPGLPGWQLTLIVVMAVLLATALAVLATRMLATRRHLPAGTARTPTAPGTPRSPALRRPS
jgi:hypothetical protein